MEQQDQSFAPTPPPQFQTDSAPVMSFGEWLVTLLIMVVPLLNVIMIIIWAADSNTNPNKANWARATLVIIGIQIILAMFFLGAIIGSMSELMKQFGNAGTW